MDVFESFEVIHKETTHQQEHPDLESLTTTVLDEMTQEYNQNIARDCYNHEGSSSGDQIIEVSKTQPTPITTTSGSTLNIMETSPTMKNDRSCSSLLITKSQIPPYDSKSDEGTNEYDLSTSMSDTDTSTSHEEVTIMETLHRQTSTATTMLRDHTSNLNTHLHSLISTLSKSMTASTGNNSPLITPRLLIITAITTFLLTFTIFAIHTILFTQLITYQQIHHANISTIERAERIYHIEKRDELRGQLMHSAYETARVNDEKLQRCGADMGKVEEQLGNCLKKKNELDVLLKECKDKSGHVNGKVAEFRRVLVLVKKENERLRGIVGLTGLCVVIWIFGKWFFKNTGKL